jgi:hypothetical protein
MSTRDFMAMLVVHTGDSLARLQHKAMEDLARTERAVRVAEGAPNSIKADLVGRVLDAEAVCAEHGALGKEC